MARRNDHTREELKALAIRSGQKVIIDEGFSNFSARKVAKEMGYTVGTLYNIFGDYDSIVLHINAKTLDDMHEYVLENLKAHYQTIQEKQENQDTVNIQSIQDLQNIINSPDIPLTQSQKMVQCADAIRNLAASYICFATKNYHRWNALFIFSLSPGTYLPDWYAEKMKHLFSLVELPFFTLFDEDAKRTEHTAKVIWASIHGICQLGLTGKLNAVGAEQVHILTEDLIKYFMQGLES